MWWSDHTKQRTEQEDFEPSDGEDELYLSGQCNQGTLLKHWTNAIWPTGPKSLNGVQNKALMRSQEALVRICVHCVIVDFSGKDEMKSMKTDIW